VGNDFIKAVIVIAGYQVAQAFPCLIGNVKEYVTGYHDGAVQGYTDYKKGHDPDIDVHVVVLVGLLLQWV
jgi:hypothetical protein